MTITVGVGDPEHLNSTCPRKARELASRGVGYPKGPRVRHHQLGPSIAIEIAGGDPLGASDRVDEG